MILNNGPVDDGGCLVFFGDRGTLGQRKNYLRPVFFLSWAVRRARDVFNGGSFYVMFSVFGGGETRGAVMH